MYVYICKNHTNTYYKPDLTYIAKEEKHFWTSENIDMQVSNKGRSQHALKKMMLKNKKIVKMNLNNSITSDTFLLQLKKKRNLDSSTE